MNIIIEEYGCCWNCGCKRVSKVIENVVDLVPDVPDGPNVWQTFVFCGNCGSLRKTQETRWWGASMSSLELRDYGEMRLAELEASSRRLSDKKEG